MPTLLAPRVTARHKFSSKLLPLARYKALTPPQTPSSAAAATQALPLPAPPARPHTAVNKSAPRPAIARASCLLFAESAGARAPDDLLPAPHRCGRAGCLVQS